MEIENDNKEKYKPKAPYTSSDWSKEKRMALASIAPSQVMNKENDENSQDGECVEPETQGEGSEEEEVLPCEGECNVPSYIMRRTLFSKVQDEIITKKDPKGVPHESMLNELETPLTESSKKVDCPSLTRVSNDACNDDLDIEHGHLNNQRGSLSVKLVGIKLTVAFSYLYNRKGFYSTTCAVTGRHSHSIELASHIWRRFFPARPRRTSFSLGLLLPRTTPSPTMDLNPFRLCSGIKVLGYFMILIVLAIVALSYDAVVVLTWAPHLRDGGFTSFLSFIIIITFHILLVMLMWSYIKVVSQDPGCVPENWKLVSEQNIEEGNSVALSDYASIQPPTPTLSTDEIERRQSQSKGYCSKCQKGKPPRCHHCSVCQRCVLKMDHHCIWVVNCVGARNYKFFLLFVMPPRTWHGPNVVPKVRGTPMTPKHPFLVNLVPSVCPSISSLVMLFPIDFQLVYHPYIIMINSPSIL
ncbi:putative protein S-acyltransferase 12 [Capsicum annuum]|nr:putative protein S-acyltransferase 12 [Capsicum annuum]